MLLCDHRQGSLKVYVECLSEWFNSSSTQFLVDYVFSVIWHTLLRVLGHQTFLTTTTITDLYIDLWLQANDVMASQLIRYNCPGDGVWFLERGFSVILAWTTWSYMELSMRLAPCLRHSKCFFLETVEFSYYYYLFNNHYVYETLISTEYMYLTLVMSCTNWLLDYSFIVHAVSRWPVCPGYVRKLQLNGFVGRTYRLRCCRTVVAVCIVTLSVNRFAAKTLLSVDTPLSLNYQSNHCSQSA